MMAELQTIYDKLAYINEELGILKAQMDIVMWFIGINIVAWVGLIVTAVGKKMLKNNKNK